MTHLLVRILATTKVIIPFRSSSVNMEPLRWACPGSEKILAECGWDDYYRVKVTLRGFKNHMALMETVT